MCEQDTRSQDQCFGGAICGILIIQSLLDMAEGMGIMIMLNKLIFRDHYGSDRTIILHNLGEATGSSPIEVAKGIKDHMRSETSSFEHHRDSNLGKDATEATNRVIVTNAS